MGENPSVMEDGETANTENSGSLSAGRLLAFELSQRVLAAATDDGEGYVKVSSDGADMTNYASGDSETGFSEESSSSTQIIAALTVIMTAAFVF